MAACVGRRISSVWAGRHAGDGSTTRLYSSNVVGGPAPAVCVMIINTFDTMSQWRPLPEIWHLTEPASASARFWTWVPLKDLSQYLDHGYHSATRTGHCLSNLKPAVSPGHGADTMWGRQDRVKELKAGSGPGGIERNPALGVTGLPDWENPSASCGPRRKRADSRQRGIGAGRL